MTRAPTWRAGTASSGRRAPWPTLGQHGIRVDTLHPHGVATGMTVDDLQPLIGQHAATLGPIFMQSLPDQVSQPDDMAAAVAWLASDEARHVTGIQLPVDLGTLTR